MGESRLSGGEKVIEWCDQNQKNGRQQSTRLSPPQHQIAGDIVN